MFSDYLDDEQQIADERQEEQRFDCGALQQPINELPGLQTMVGVSPDTSVRAAIREMIGKRVGCVLVLEDGKVVGVFSERDVLCKVSVNDIDIDATPVAQLMTRRPETVPADCALVYALHKMTIGGYRHIPVLDSDGLPVAVVSMRDIVDFLVSLAQEEILNLPDPDQPRATSREGA